MLRHMKNTQEKPKVPEEISKYMSELGKKGGAKNKAKGSAYFKMIRAKRSKQLLEEKGTI